MIFTILFSAYAYAVTPMTIYNGDSRVEVFQAPEEIARLAESTAAMFDQDQLFPMGNTDMELRAETYGERYGLCASENFVGQISAGLCSGFLAAPDKVITAAHCIQQQDCAERFFVFGYSRKHENDPANRVASQDVYACKRVQSYKHLNYDVAVVQLDRVVRDRKPLRVKAKAKLKKGERLFAIGYPGGLPAKVDMHQHFRRIKTSNPLEYFVSGDFMDRSSGTAVFSARSHSVIGILTDGAMDFQKQGQCHVSRHCESERCGGEIVTAIPK
jgi:hypothetical protein